MKRMIQYFRILLYSLLAKGKALWQKIKNKIYSEELVEEISETTFINAEPYDSLFDSHTTNEQILVSKQLWDRIQTTLPARYKMPNPDNISQLNSMRSDSYDQLFSNSKSSPLTFVDSVIWNRITGYLPKSYTLPHPHFEKLTQTMNEKYYESLFSIPFTNSKQIFVDNNFWEPIKNNLPNNYSLPNPTSDRLFKVMDTHTNHTKNNTESFEEIRTDEQIIEKINNSLPLNYKIPDLTNFKN